MGSAFAAIDRPRRVFLTRSAVGRSTSFATMPWSRMLSDFRNRLGWSTRPRPVVTPTSRRVDVRAESPRACAPTPAVGDPRRSPVLHSAWAAGLFTLALAACDAPESDPTSELASLDRLAFVPAGECRLLGRDGVEVRGVTTTALLVERYEVSRADWERWAGSGEAASATELPSPHDAWPDAAPTWPASGMTLVEARAFAETRSMRLPTASEWIRIASGTRGQPFPWGLARASAVANTAELGLGRPVPGGAFEQGASPDSIYDLLGNVAEWVENPLPIAAGADVDVRPLGWALGGSYATRLAKIHDLDRTGRIVIVHVDLDPRTRALDVGLRCVVEARVWLGAHAPDLGATSREREGLRRIGARWGRDAVPLLEELSASPGARSSLRHLLEGARG